jgi:hypothetical protein
MLWGYQDELGLRWVNSKRVRDRVENHDRLVPTSTPDGMQTGGGR